MCHCPAHPDANPSLHVTLKDDKVLVHCMAGCDQSDVIDALRSRGLWPERSERKRRQYQHRQDIPEQWPVKPKKGEKVFHLVGQYRYYDWQHCNLIGIVGRYENEDKKQVVPFFQRWQSGAWRSGLGKYKHSRPWYGLHLLNDQANLIIVEGEKCAQALNKQGLDVLAITWQGGCKVAERIDYAALIRAIAAKGRNLQGIYFWPDSDVQGVQCMYDIWEKIKDEIDISMSLIDPEPMLKDSGWDAADFLREYSIKQFGDIEETGEIYIRINC
jgi:hypothetical protein